MQAEIEAKFLDVNHDELRAQLRSVGAQLVQPMRAMRRINFDYPEGTLHEKHGFVRVRDEGDKITLSYKQVDDLGADGTKEICVEVSSYDETVSLLRAIGLEQKAYQETRRESWTYKGCEIELDEWPAIKPLVEIEAPNERSLWALAKELKIDNHEIMHGTGDYLYAREFEVTTDEVNAWPTITFNETPELLAGRERKKVAA